MAGEFIDAPAPQFIDAPGPKFIDAPAPSQASSEWFQPPGVSFKVRKAVTPDTGKPTFQREDGALYYGKDQGNKGKPQWFGAQGQPAGSSPGASTNSLGKDILDSFTIHNPVVHGITGIPLAAAQFLDTLPDVTDLWDKDLNDKRKKALQDYINEREREFRSAPSNQGIIADIGVGIGQSALPMPKGLPLQAIPKGMTAVVKAFAPNMAAQGAASAILAPVTGNPEDVAQGKLEQAGLGAGIGAVVQGGTKVIPKLYNAIRGTVKAEYAPLVDAAEAHGIKDYTVGDITRSRAAKTMEKEAENIPSIIGGTGRVREKGLDQIDKAVRDKVTDLAEKMNIKKYGGYDGLAKAAESGDANSRRILKILDDAASDPHRVLRADLESQMALAKIKTGAAYDEVGKAVEGLGDVDLTKTVGWIDSEIGKAEKLLNPDKSKLITGILGKYREKLVSPELAGYRGYNQVRDAVSAMGEEASELAAKQDYAAAKVVGDLRGKLRSNMDSWVSSAGVPETKDLLNNANKVYQKDLLPFKKETIKKMLEGEYADQAVKKIYSDASPDEFKAIWDASGPKGKSAIQYALTQEAADKAFNPTTGKISPASFASYMEKRADQVGIAFKGEPKWYMDGFVKLLRHMERAGQLAAGQDTGKGAIKWGIAGAAATASPQATAGALAVANTSKFLLTSKAGKRLLLAASEATPGSKAMQSIVEDIALKATAAGSASMNSAPITQPEPGAPE